MPELSEPPELPELPEPGTGQTQLAAVAVPIPIPSALTYRIPDALVPLAVAGVRVRVRVGKRRVIGVLIERPTEAPDGVRLQPLEEILDREPVFPPALMELARFASDYYLAPIGEVFQTMLPGELPPWGFRKVSLTSAGAIAPAKNDAEAMVIDALRAGGRMRLADLQKELGGSDLGETIDRLAVDGRVRLETRDRGGARYLSAVELPAGDLEAKLEACGRSPQGRAVVELLSGLGRPATIDEITREVACTPAVVRRLVKLEILRKFTQIETLNLDRHVMAAQTPGERLILRPDQETAVQAIEGAVDAGDFASFLLGGMTGAGKTEVFLRAADRVVEQGRSVILLVPEIGMVPALARSARARFGDRLAILHSALAAGERHQEWERIASGAARVVVGPRSALFAPVRDLGLIVVDEEQDSSYKQDVTPRYHGRDLALVRARGAGAVAVLVSATPSLETRLNVDRGKYRRVDLTQRAGHGQLPEGILVDLKDEPVTRKPGEIVFSERLCDEIEATIRAGDQLILLRNRRGYSPTLLCRACGEDHRCDACGLARTYHLKHRMLICHYCGSRLPAPKICPSCQEEALEPMGAGTERVEERFRERFPDVSTDVLDRDAVRRPGGAAAVLARFDRGETQALIGTQMVSKGHHFPRVALTAVLSADTYLGFPDFRAVERTYNLLTQLAGRAGRGERPGRVVIQSYHPDHYAIQAALNNDDDRFVQEEMRFRQVFHYPPYTRMVQLLSRHRNRSRAQARLEEAAQRLAAHPLAEGARMSGPAPAHFERLRGQWRFQLLVRTPRGSRLRRWIAAALPDSLRADLIVDVDPHQLL